MTTPTSSRFPRIPRSLLVIAVLMVVFGLAEIVTSFTHSFFGLTTSQALFSTVLGIVLGACYLASGLLLFTGSRRAAAVAIFLLCVDVIGRVAMVATGLYPLGSFRQGFAIVVGTALAACFAAYIALRWKVFR